MQTLFSAKVFGSLTLLAALALSIVTIDDSRESVDSARGRLLAGSGTEIPGASWTSSSPSRSSV